MRILELLRDGERSVGTLQAELELDSGGTSQHLAALRRIGLVESRRSGTSVFSRVADERVFDLLTAGRAIISRRLAEQQSIAGRPRDDVTAAVLLVALGVLALGGVGFWILAPGIEVGTGFCAAGSLLAGA